MTTRIYNDPFLRFLVESSQAENQKRHACGCSPSTNVKEEQESFRIEMSVPGFDKEDISISIEKDILIIASENKEKKEQEAVTYTRKEFGRYDFRRSFRLPETVDQEQIQAEFKNGILTVTLPKKEEVKVKKEIAIA